jgi:lysophospholipase L1-like esterase
MSPFKTPEGMLSKRGAFGLPGLMLFLALAAVSCGGVRASEDPKHPPAVATLGASSITVEGATLNGTVSPNGFDADAWFEWGTDPDLEFFASTTEQFISAGTDNQALSATITGLAPWTIYYYRLVVSGGAETMKGTIRSFPSGEYYVAVGDSITRGSKDDFPDDDTSEDGRNSGGGYEPVLNDLLTDSKRYPHTVVNEGVSGGNAVTGLDRMPEVVSRHLDAKYFLVMYGTNDAGLAYPSGLGLGPLDEGYDGTYKDYMQRIIWTIASAGKIPCLAKIPYTLEPARNIVILEFNLVVEELVTENFIPVTPPDFYAYFENHPGELADDLHPNGMGYRSMAAMWAAALTR